MWEDSAVEAIGEKRQHIYCALLPAADREEKRGPTINGLLSKPAII